MLLLPLSAVEAQAFRFSELVALGADTDERLRLKQLLGAASGDAYLLRSASSLTFRGDTSTHRRPDWGLLSVDLRVVRNSGIPMSLNDGALWAGRGWNHTVTAGAYFQTGRIRVVVAPTLIAEDNRPFQVIPFPQNDSTKRNVWANPFHPLPESIDQPLRFGDRPRRRLDPGQSSIVVDLRPVSVGFGTENRWWGPGIRNAIALSNNAAGFPHAFVQLPRPRHTPYGTFDGQWLLGKLSESAFFDADSANDTRTLSALAFTWSPPGDEGLTLGVGRMMMAAQRDDRVPIGAFFDVLRSAGHATADTARPVKQRRDQITTLFARWVFPRAGFEAYTEWARFEEPRSLRDLLESPGHSEGYTLGLQWARAITPHRTIRLQAEASYLEPDPSLRVRPVAITYTSRAVPHGFTNRGETLGAAIGPGASSQWLATDVVESRWNLGAYLSRIRWDNGVLFEPIVPEYKRQDVTLAAGLRGGVTWQGVRAVVDFSHAARFNYLFQSYILGAAKFGGIDLVNNTLSVSITALVPGR